MLIKIASDRVRSGRAVLILLMIVLLGLMASQACESIPVTTISVDEPTTQLEPDNTVSFGVSVGEQAPDFTLVDLNDNPISLSDFRGKTVFLNFWATWCPPCRAEMPQMEALYQDYKDEDVVIIGLDIQETREEVSQYVQQGGYSWLFILDTSGKVATNYEVTAIPTSFFIDGDGIIRAVSTGAMSKRDMEIALTKAMR